MTKPSKARRISDADILAITFDNVDSHITEDIVNSLNSDGTETAAIQSGYFYKQKVFGKKSDTIIVSDNAAFDVQTGQLDINLVLSSFDNQIVNKTVFWKDEQIGVTIENNIVQFYYYNGNDWYKLSGISSLLADTPYHVTVQWDAGQMTVIVNGTIENTDYIPTLQEKIFYMHNDSTGDRHLMMMDLDGTNKTSVYNFNDELGSTNDVYCSMSYNGEGRIFFNSDHQTSGNTQLYVADFHPTGGIHNISRLTNDTLTYYTCAPNWDMDKIAFERLHDPGGAGGYSAHRKLQTYTYNDTTKTVSNLQTVLFGSRVSEYISRDPWSRYDTSGYVLYCSDNYNFDSEWEALRTLYDGSASTSLGASSFQLRPAQSPTEDLYAWGDENQSALTLIETDQVTGTSGVFSVKSISNVGSIELKNPCFTMDGDRIIHESNEDGDDNLFVTDKVGNVETKLTTYTGSEKAEFAFCRNVYYTSRKTSLQSKVFYTWYDGSNWEIYMMNEDGSSKTQISNLTTLGNSVQPYFTIPRKYQSRILITSNHDTTTNRQIYVGDIGEDGQIGTLTRLITDSNDYIGIAVNDSLDIINVTTDEGASITDIVRFDYNDSTPAVSNKTTIVNSGSGYESYVFADAFEYDSTNDMMVYWTDKGGGGHKVYRYVNATDSENLLLSGFNVVHPSWSPKENRMAYSINNGSGDRDINTASSTDGSSTALLTGSVQDSDYFPCWQIDGEGIFWIYENDIHYSNIDSSYNATDIAKLTSLTGGEYASTPLNRRIWLVDDGILNYSTDDVYIGVKEVAGDLTEPFTGGISLVKMKSSTDVIEKIENNYKLYNIGNGGVDTLDSDIFVPKCIFSSDFETGNFALYYLNEDSTEAIRIIFNDSYNYDAPMWSRQGDKVAFHSDQWGATNNIGIYDLNDKSITQVTTHGAGEYPSWSPDGTQILYQKGSDVYKINIDGSGDTLVKTGVSVETDAWARDDSFIVYAKGTGVNRQIYKSAPDGTGETQLTTGTVYQYDRPSISHDSLKVCFDNGALANIIGVVNADGTGESILEVTTTDFIFHPSFNYDGTEIFYVRNVGKGTVRNLYRNGVATWSSDTQITFNTGSFNTNHPSSYMVSIPDVKKQNLIFRSKEDGWSNIWIGNPAATSRTQLTNFTDNNLQNVTVHPKGHKIAYAYSSNIYELNLINNETTQITNSGTDNHPVYCISNNRLYFWSSRSSSQRLGYLADNESEVAGDTITWLTNAGTDVHNDSFDVSPDGNKLVFGKGSSPINIYTIDTDNTNLTQITNNGYDTFSPQWHPDGTTIAYVAISGSQAEIYKKTPVTLGGTQTKIISSGANITNNIPRYDKTSDGYYIYNRYYDSGSGNYRLYESRSTDGGFYLSLIGNQTYVIDIRGEGYGYGR